MTDYERLLKRVKMLNVELSVNAAAAHARSDQESPTEYGGDRDTHSGRADAFDDAKQLVEAILEDFPDKSKLISTDFELGDWVDVHNFGGDKPGRVVSIHYGADEVSIRWPHLNDAVMVYDCENVQRVAAPKVKF